MELIELEDTDWFPDVLRDQQLAYIGWLVQILDMYAPLRPLLDNWVGEADPSRVQDLCSGSGEPLVSLSDSFSRKIEITLSDKFPPKQSIFRKGINYLSTSEDALDLNFDSGTYYTMFNAFHHFENTQQHELVKRMVQSNSSFCFVEVLQPTFFILLKVIFANTLGQLLFAPFVRPFTFKRLLFTYILPINLFTTTYDGIISVLKSKTKTQYQTLLSDISTDDYRLAIESYRAPYYNNIIVIRGYAIH